MSEKTKNHESSDRLKPCERAPGLTGNCPQSWLELSAGPWGLMCTGTVGRRVFWINGGKHQVTRAFCFYEVTRAWSLVASACCSHCREMSWRHCWGPVAGVEAGEGAVALL